MLSPQFSVQRPAFLKAVFQCESFDVGLIRVGESPEVRVTVLSRVSIVPGLFQFSSPGTFGLL